MSKKLTSSESRRRVFPRTSWKPFFLGIGDALNVAPRTNYHRVRIDPGRAWGMVGRDIFDAAECIGTLRDTSRHVVDLILTDGGRTRTRCIGRVFEYRHPISGGDEFVAIYHKSDGTIEAVGVSQHVAEDEPEEPEPDAPVQVNWVDQESARDR